ncbi:M42 family metallopeptidase [Fusibacter tunisiensis]|uniref:Aminopeptidase FrvX n=1 Tax=Fusibacter tunisiensis TaxID=1008308 RepID=A0ABS2MS71_9FIRM|nr:M42 family metallopeptidase [Fusibacter tunisiensis]MBM7562220.1 putative aminopeptidase FrvX [Fusibacter tunisiensis]
MQANKTYVLELLKDLLMTDSPSGYTSAAMAKLSNWAKELGYNLETTPKGTGIITLEGEDNSRTIGLSAHVDTLGAMVRSITSKGTLKFTLVGGPIAATLDGEYCTIHTRDGSLISGTFLSTAPSSHVNKDAHTQARTPDTMEIRLDAPVHNKQDVLDLGISVGDFICIDPKTTLINDFVKSRFIDDKASVACLYGVMAYLSENKLKPKYKTKIILSVYEEVGHGASYLPSDIEELLAVDMGCIGEDLTCTEFDVSICAKDSSGPYDYGMVSKLIDLSKAHDLKYAVDIYPFYGSDVSAALRSGNNIKGGLIGPGVHASHGMERTHYSALENTMKLVYAYLIG